MEKNAIELIQELNEEKVNTDDIATKPIITNESDDGIEEDIKEINEQIKQTNSSNEEEFNFSHKNDYLESDFSFSHQNHQGDNQKFIFSKLKEKYSFYPFPDINTQVKESYFRLTNKNVR